MDRERFRRRVLQAACAKATSGSVCFFFFFFFSVGKSFSIPFIVNDTIYLGTFGILTI